MYPYKTRSSFSLTYTDLLAYTPTRLKTRHLKPFFSSLVSIPLVRLKECKACSIVCLTEHVVHSAFSTKNKS